MEFAKIEAEPKPSMEPSYPFSWAELRFPWRRAELLGHLKELLADDPRHGWAADRLGGAISGIDEVIHFFFDDNDFDEADIGVSLLNQTEVSLVQLIKHELDQIVQELPEGGDNEYVTHPRWAAVTAAAIAAYDAINRC